MYPNIYESIKVNLKGLLEKDSDNPFEDYNDKIINVYKFHRKEEIETTPTYGIGYLDITTKIIDKRKFFGLIKEKSKKMIYQEYNTKIMENVYELRKSLWILLNDIRNIYYDYIIKELKYKHPEKEYKQIDIFISQFNNFYHEMYSNNFIVSFKDIIYLYQLLDGNEITQKLFKHELKYIQYNPIESGILNPYNITTVNPYSFINILKIYDLVDFDKTPTFNDYLVKNLNKKEELKNIIDIITNNYHYYNLLTGDILFTVNLSIDDDFYLHVIDYQENKEDMESYVLIDKDYIKYNLFNLLPNNEFKKIIIETNKKIEFMKYTFLDLFLDTMISTLWLHYGNTIDEYHFNNNNSENIYVIKKIRTKLF